MAEDFDPSLLVVIVDTDPHLWKERTMYGSEKEIGLNDFLRCLAIFCNSHALLHRKNRLIVLANHSYSVKTVFPCSMSGDAVGYEVFIPKLHELSHQIVERVSELAILKQDHDVNQENTNRTSSIANALSIALCAANKQVEKTPRLHCRIVVLQMQKDVAQNYNAVMNAVFSAQKLHVSIDAVALNKDGSNFLQQASFLTKGIYQQLNDQSNLLQVLLTHYLSNASLRRSLLVPLQVGFIPF